MHHRLTALQLLSKSNTMLFVLFFSFFFLFFLFSFVFWIICICLRYKDNHPPSPLHTRRLKSQHHEIFTTVLFSTPSYDLALGGRVIPPLHSPSLRFIPLGLLHSGLMDFVFFWWCFLSLPRFCSASLRALARSATLSSPPMLQTARYTVCSNRKHLNRPWSISLFSLFLWEAAQFRHECVYR